MIAQQAIEAEFDRLEEANFEAVFTAFSQEQPYLAAYLDSDDIEAFTPGEQSLLYMSAMIIYQVIKDAYGAPKAVTGEEIANAEESILETLQAQESSIFRHRMDVFFEGTPEEDLLAFLEDMLTPEEDEEDELVTREGREPLFVILKSCMDTLLAAAGR